MTDSMRALIKNPEPWLVLSHAFNMDGRAASQTITDKLPHLVKVGIQPIVVSSMLGSLDRQYEHHRILPFGGAGLRFDLRHVLRQYLGVSLFYKLTILLITLLLAPFIILEKLIFGLDSQSSWSVPAFLMGCYLVRKKNIRIVYSTGGAYSAHIAGYWLKKWLKIIWIAEIHDPLVNPQTINNSRSNRYTKNLESKICQNADLAWWFTKGALESANTRHPNAGARMMAVLPGAEPPKFQEINHVYGNSCIFSHFGTLTHSRSLVYFLQGFQLWRQGLSTPPLCEIHIYGSKLDEISREFVEKHNLSHYIYSFGRLEYSQALQLSGREQVNMKMRTADCLLLTHGSTNECAEYIPSKFYEYLWSGRPMLAMVHKNPQLEALAKERQLYLAQATNSEAIANEIQTIYADWLALRLDLKTSLEPIGVEASVKTIVRAVHSLPAWGAHEA